jgi:hypothetical protein
MLPLEPAISLPSGSSQGEDLESSTCCRLAICKTLGIKGLEVDRNPGSGRPPRWDGHMMAHRAARRGCGTEIAY